MIATGWGIYQSTSLPVYLKATQQKVVSFTTNVLSGSQAERESVGIPRADAETATAKRTTGLRMGVGAVATGGTSAPVLAQSQLPPHVARKREGGELW